jgi:endonuclease G
MKITTSELWAAREARRVAVAFNIYNPRVRLIDIGWKQVKGEPTGDLAVRFHLIDKPSKAVIESFCLEENAFFVDTSKIHYTTDIIQAGYHLQQYWLTPYAPVSERARCCEPMCGGISISNGWFYNYGTLGGFVIDKDTRERMILSNWHVLAGTIYAPKGLKIYQPGIGDGGGYQDAVATLERDVMAQGIDAAVAKLNTGRTCINNQLAWGAVKGVEEPRLGMKVVKSGRKSEVTYGVIDGIEGDYPIWYGGLQRWIKHVYSIKPQPGNTEVSQGGDSGSWWLNQATSRAVGLHFAGMNDPEVALAIAMPKVLDTLNVEILV